LVSAVRFFEVHPHHRVVVKQLDKQRLATSEIEFQAQLEVTVSAYDRQVLPSSRYPDKSRQTLKVML
jgi:hypothetical protein